jgi:hypothetical protein
MTKPKRKRNAVWRDEYTFKHYPTAKANQTLFVAN